jgi:hypothetical protein
MPFVAGCTERMVGGQGAANCVRPAVCMPRWSPAGDGSEARQLLLAGLYPGEPNFPRFTAWLGSYSTSNKQKRCGLVAAGCGL